MRPVVPTSSTYDETHYPHRSFAACHPDRLAVIASLHGLSPAPVQSARVLEIGCGTGGNLLPLACELPGAHLVGIDPSVSQIETASTLARSLHIENVELVPVGIEALDAEAASFDYILCHGVFSWVSIDTQEALLAGIARLLAPNGVAYLSHTCLPGWRERQIVRDLARFHLSRRVDASRFRQNETGSSRTELSRAARVRDIVDRVMSAVPDEHRAHAAHLRWEADVLRSADDAYIVHEHLADDAHPTLLIDLARRAEGVGLTFLGDAIPHRFSLSMASPELAELTRDCSVIDAQQYLDFASNTSFRQSLFVHAPTQGQPDPSRARSMWVRSQLRPTNDLDLARNTPVWFEANGGGVSLDLPIVKAAAVELLKAAPRAVHFDELVQRAAARLGPGEVDIGEATDVLANELLLLFAETDLIELHAYHPAFETGSTKRPIACAHARHQARVGGVITNRWHHEVRFEDRVVIDVLSRLDGTRDARDIAVELHDAHANAATGSVAPTLEAVETTIALLAWSALIVGEGPGELAR